MLPLAVTRNVHGISTRAAAPESQTAQLVGRSRAERMLDRFYNRQGKFIKKNLHPDSRPSNVKTEIKKQEIKKEEPQNESSGLTKIEPISIVDRLIKSANNSDKFEKTFNLSYQLINSIYFEPYLNHFIDLYTALASSDHINLIPKQRPKIVELSEKIKNRLQCALPVDKAGSDAPFKKLRACPKGLEYKEEAKQMSMLDVDKDEIILLSDWVHILNINSIWHNMVLTDDSFKFNQALRQIDAAIKSLPLPDLQSKPCIDIITLLKTHRANNTVTVKKEDHDCTSDTDNDVKDNEYSCFLPKKWEALEYKRQSLLKSLKIIQAYGGAKWSRSAVLQFFSQIYLNREKFFYESDFPLLESYQSSILQKDVLNDKAKLLNVLSAGECAHPIADGRDEKIIAVHEPLSGLQNS